MEKMSKETKRLQKIAELESEIKKSNSRFSTDLFLIDICSLGIGTGIYGFFEIDRGFILATAIGVMGNLLFMPMIISESHNRSNLMALKRWLEIAEELGLEQGNPEDIAKLKK